MMRRFVVALFGRLTELDSGPANIVPATTFPQPPSVFELLSSLSLNPTDSSGGSCAFRGTVLRLFSSMTKNHGKP